MLRRSMDIGVMSRLLTQSQDARPIRPGSPPLGTLGTLGTNSVRDDVDFEVVSCVAPMRSTLSRY